MGCDERTWNEEQADRFLAGFVDATPELIAVIELERGGNLGAVVAESVGYWERKMTERVQRREARDRIRAAQRARAFRASALAQSPNERARLAPAPEPFEVVLPVPRFVLLTDAEYEESRRWWARLENPSAARRLAIRIRREIRDGARQQREAVRTAAAWRLEQRAFERAQWRAVIANRDSRPARKRANQWIAIDQDRALAIAKAALEKAGPPQAHK